MEVILGVEIEFHVEDDPRPDKIYETRYPVIVSHTRNQPQGNVHRVHGELVQEISELTNDEIRVGYDLTASFGDSQWEGYELSSVPLDGDQTLKVWKMLYESDAKMYLNPDPDLARRQYAPAHHSCGMHIHLSGDDLTLNCIDCISEFINSRENASLIKHIAGRYDTRFCRIMPRDEAFIQCLFHSADCANIGKIDRGEIPKGQGQYCCANADKLAEYIYDFQISRHAAVNHLPNANTGAIELRLFSSPNDYSRAAANIQFALALVQFCGSLRPVADMRYHKFCAWLQTDRARRREFRHLFRYLRGAGYVRGLIPLQ